jgi:hypothetical protein
LEKISRSQAYGVGLTVTPFAREELTTEDTFITEDTVITEDTSITEDTVFTEDATGAEQLEKL